VDFAVSRKLASTQHLSTQHHFAAGKAADGRLL